MSDDQFILQNDGAVVTLTIDRPDQLNVLSPTLVRNMLEMLRSTRNKG